jgi:hypothetical protein
VLQILNAAAVGLDLECRLCCSAPRFSPDPKRNPRFCESGAGRSIVTKWIASACFPPASLSAPSVCDNTEVCESTRRRCGVVAGAPIYWLLRLHAFAARR